MVKEVNAMIEPKNHKYFRFSPSLEEYYKKASVIIGHGGTATMLEALAHNAKVIGADNRDRPDLHQEDILKHLDKEGYILWCRDLDKLEENVKKVKKMKLLLIGMMQWLSSVLW